MNKYPTKIEELNLTLRTGRVVFIDDPTKITPRELYKYIDEGFVPVACSYYDDASETSVVYAFVTSSVRSNGTYGISGLDYPYEAKSIDDFYEVKGE